MRAWCLAAVAAILVVCVLPTAAAAQTTVGVRALDCRAVAAHGAGLPARTKLTLTVRDPATGRVLGQADATTDVAGAFSATLGLSLSGLRSVRLVVATPGAARPLAWSEQTTRDACPLARTGVPSQALPLAGVGLSSAALGVLLVAAVARRGRQLAPAYQGRQLAAAYQGRHLAPAYQGRHLAR